MPKIYEYFGFIFYFYSNEHEPIHVHVIHQGTEAIFDLILESGELIDIKRREKKHALPLSSQDEKEARTFIRAYYKNIVEKWVNFFVMRKQIRTTVIKKKL